MPAFAIDAVGGWPGLRNKDPNVFLLGCKAAVIVMDGDEGRQLAESGCPLTDMAEEEQRRFAAAGIDLLVLQRYGIENYFPRAAFEKIIGRNLSAFFPIPIHVSPLVHLSLDKKGFEYRFKRWVAARLGLKLPQPRQPLYAKSRNEEIASDLQLERDFAGTNLHEVIHLIAQRARDLVNV